MMKTRERSQNEDTRLTAEVTGKAMDKAGMAISKGEILLVEDSQTQREMLKQFLEESGYSVSVAANGEDATRQLAEHKPALIICDVVMPFMDGYALCKSVKRNPALRDIPVLLLTSLTDAEDVIKALHCGADNFVAKPYDEHYLLTRVEDLIVTRDFNEHDAWQIGMKFTFAGVTHTVNSDRRQILDVLISTFENAVVQSRMLASAQSECRLLSAKVEELSRELLSRQASDVSRQVSGTTEQESAVSASLVDRAETAEFAGELHYNP